MSRGTPILLSLLTFNQGQYHFVYIVTPERYRRFAAFVVGWMTLIGWWVVTCSGVTLAAVAIFGMVEFWNPTFHVHQWMIYCAFFGVVVVSVESSFASMVPDTVELTEYVAVVPLFVCPKFIPKIAQTTLYLSVLGFITCFTVIVSMKKHTQPVSYIVKPNLGTSGWGQGTAWVLGISNAM